MDTYSLYGIVPGALGNALSGPLGTAFGGDPEAYISTSFEGLFNSHLEDFTTVFPAQVSAFGGTLAGNLADFTSLFSGTFYYFSGQISSTFTNVTSSLTGTHLTPRSGTLFSSLAIATITITGRFTLTTGTFSSTLANLTSTITIRFYYFTGNWSSTLINAGIIIRGGSLLSGVFSKTLIDVYTTIRLRVPIAINATLAITTAYLTRSIYGRAHPTGSLTRTLTDCTVNIRGTLPIAITATFNTYIPQLSRNFIGRAWPAGNLSRTLVSCTVVITGKVPIRITVTLALIIDIIRTNIRAKSPVAGYIATNTNNIYLLWHLNFQMPRRGDLSSILIFRTVFYAKVSNSGTIGFTLAATTSNINLRTPIRIYVTLGLTTSRFSTFLIRAKCAVGGHLASTMVNTRTAIYLQVPCWLQLNTTVTDVTMLITGRVPIAITGTADQTLLNATTYFIGRGHYSPTFNPTLATLIANFRIHTSIKGVLTLTEFTGPFITVNKFFSALIGDQWPYRSGKYWKLQIFGNNGDQDVTTFEKLRLLKQDSDGNLVDVLADVVQSKQFSADNTEYSSPNGMQIIYTLSEDTEIKAYEMDGA